MCVFFLLRKDAEWDKLLKICLSVGGVKVELEGYLNRHNKKRGWKQLMDHLRQPGAGNLANWHDLLEELGTRDIDGLTVGKFVEALCHQNVGLSTASLELKAVLKPCPEPVKQQCMFVFCGFCFSYSAEYDCLSICCAL